MSLNNVYISFFILVIEISTLKVILLKVYKASKQLTGNEISAHIRLLRHTGHVAMALSQVRRSKWRRLCNELKLRFTMSFSPTKCDHFT